MRFPMSSISPIFPQFFFLGDRMQWTTRRHMNNLVHPTRMLSLEGAFASTCAC